MNLVYTFAHDDPGTIHLRGIRDSKTLCGAKAFAAHLSGDRRRVTCAECKKRKPAVLGGNTL